MDRIDRLMQNRCLRHILYETAALLLLGAAGSFALAHALAVHLMRGRIEAMLAAAGGGKFTVLPTEAAVAAGEAAFSSLGITAAMPPAMMEAFHPTRRLLFWCIYGVMAAAVLLFALCRYRETDAQLVGLYALYDECTRLAETMEGSCPASGELQSGLRRVSDGINLLLFQLRRRSEHFERMQSELRSFLTELSHQLKNSLAVVRLNQDMLAEIELQPAQRDQLNREINLHLDGMEHMLLESLKFTRLKAEAIAYKMVECDLADTVERAAERVDPLCRAKGITLSVQYDPQYVFLVRHDPMWLREAIENLLKNAADHAGCTELTVELTAISGAYKLLLTDNGRGIPQREVPRLFRPTLKKRAQSSMQNAGVGLPIAKKIIQAHGGDISVYSRPGGGTQFVLLFLRSGAQ